MAYAENTEVSIEKSISEIVALIRKHGADRVAQIQEPSYLALQFFLHDRLLRFKVTLPTWEQMPSHVQGNWREFTQEQREKKAVQAGKQRARALLLVIKAKLESVESNVETFEEAFLANIVTPGGPTVGDWLIPQIEECCRIGKMPTQLMLTDKREDA